MSNHDFCRASLRLIRTVAKRDGVNIPRMYTHSNGASRPYYTVFSNDGDNILWEGYSCCAADAKSRYILLKVEGNIKKRGVNDKII